MHDKAYSTAIAPSSDVIPTFIFDQPLENLLTPVEIEVFLRLCAFCGAEAFENGKKVSETPWCVGTEEQGAWVEGWCMAARKL